MSVISYLIKRISIYGLLGFVGITAGLIYLVFAYRYTRIQNSKKHYSFDDIIYVYVFSIIFAMIGAKLLYFIVEFEKIYSSIKIQGIKYSTFEPYFLGGFVYYGGLIGAIIGCIAVCRFFSFEFDEISRYLLPTLPLIHGFGRIGCSIVGCCYGKETSLPFYVMYIHSVYAPNNVQLFPTQIIEAIFEFIVFVVVACLCIRGHRGTKVLKTYLVLYASFRFFMEFMRDDSARGFLLGLSTSQWISMIIILSVLCVYLIPIKSICSKESSTEN